MVMRDDQAAALARAEALERELADRERALDARDEELQRLRAEVAALRADGNQSDAKRKREEAREQRKRQREARKQERERERAAAKQGKSSRKKSLVLPVVGWSASISLIVGLVFGYSHCALRYFSGADLERALLLPARAGGAPRVLLLARKSRGRRLDLLDARTGVRLARRALSKSIAYVWSAGAGRLWTVRRYRPKRVALLDAETLQDVYAWSDLLRLNPALAAGLHGSSNRYDPATKGVIVTTSSGDNLVIDPRTGRASRFAGRGSYHPGKGSGTTYHVKVQDLTYRFGTLTGSRRQVLRVQQSGPGSRSGADPGDVGKDSFLDPRFLADTTTRQAIELPAGRGFVIRHKAKLGGARELLVTAVSRDGRAGWTYHCPPGTLKGVFQLGSVLILAMRKYPDKSFVVALDLATGQVRWRYRC